MKKLIIFLSLLANTALAQYCDKPNAPSFPQKPICSNYTGYAGCSEFDVDKYNDSVERYYRNLDNFNREMQNYVDCINSPHQQNDYGSIFPN